MEAGGDAVSAIIDYSDALSMIERALNITMATEEVLERAVAKADQLMEEEVAMEVSALLTAAQASLEIARELNETVQGVPLPALITYHYTPYSARMSPENIHKLIVFYMEVLILCVIL